MKTQRYTLLFVLCLSTAVAHADDVTPPPWRNANTSWTVQEWDFNSPTPPGSTLAPDGGTWGSGGGGYVNPNGVPLFLNSTGTYLPTLTTHTGLYSLVGGQSMDFNIPNDGPSNDEKDLWIQITSFSGGLSILPQVTVGSFAFNGPATLVSSFTSTTLWDYSVWSVHMPSCPAFERINISNNSPVAIAIDEVVVDSICNPVPEPASMAVLGLGVGGIISRRRNKGKAA